MDSIDWNAYEFYQIYAYRYTGIWNPVLSYFLCR